MKPCLIGVINLRRIRKWLWIAALVVIILVALSLARHIQTAKGSPTEWSIVVFGIDPDPGQWEGRKPFEKTKIGDVRARTDAILLVRVDTESDTVRVVQVPRDSLVMTERGWQKINGLLFYGGLKYTQDALFRLVPHRFIHTVMVSYEGLEEMIDAVGGVSVEVDRDLVTPKGDIWLSQGVHTLNGEEAFRFARHRYKDPLGDLGRIKRQKQLMQAFREKAFSVSPTIYYELLKTATKMIKTDLSLRDIVILGEYLIMQQPRVEFMMLPGEARPPEWHYYPDERGIIKSVIPFINGA